MENVRNLNLKSELLNNFDLQLRHVAEDSLELPQFEATFSAHDRQTLLALHLSTLTTSWQWKAASRATTNEKLSAHQEDEVVAQVSLAAVEASQVTSKNTSKNF